MATIVKGADYKSAPRDYAAFFELYYPIIVNKVGTLGIHENHQEDVASEIIAAFIRTDVIGQFEPDHECRYAGEARAANFRSFVGSKVELYVRGHRDRLNKIKRREVLLCDLMLGGDETKHGLHSHLHEGATWLDLQRPQRTEVDDVIEWIAEEQDAQYVRTWLKQQPKRSRSDIFNLVDVYDAVRAQLAEFGEYDVDKLKALFDISTTTMHSWLWTLKSYLAQYYGRPCPPKRPRVIRGSQ